MLRWRAVTALVLAPLALIAIAAGQWAVFAIILLVVIGAAYELARALTPLPFPAALGAGVFPILFSVPYGANGVLVGAVLGLPWALFWLGVRPETRTLRAVLAVLLMSLWVGVPMAHLILLSKLDDFDVAEVAVLVAVVGPWISDTGAYFGGRFFGRRLLFPTLSPKKTVEGGVGGLILTVLVVGLTAWHFLSLSIPGALLLGAVVSICSQAGDLFESMLKRILDVKDLGHLLPGHGGILDRVDSLLFTAPAVYYFLFFL